MDWVTISSLATAAGTLVLAVATFASVRSSNRAARVAELSVLANLRPLLMPSRLDDSVQKVGFMDGKWFTLPGGSGAAEATDEAVYLVMSLRNVSTGTAVLHGWWMTDHMNADDPPPLDQMHRLTRDIFVAAGDLGFWQGSFRDPAAEDFREARRAVESGETLGVSVMYGDLEGGQRTITRFAMVPKPDGGYLVSAGRVWNIDRPGPR
ncbi:MAG TPA: hypothetical protein VGU02_16795 [Gaiellaceae bacterium]|nr:hypothetical protein [Gaiellaceae bacterium]